MEELDGLLKRFKSSLGRDVSEREAIAEAIHKSVGFQIRLEDLSIKGDAIHIKTTPTKKNEIKLKEESLLKAVRDKLDLKLTRILYL